MIREVELARLVSLYANHKETCNCFICRNLSDTERKALAEFWEMWGSRKHRTTKDKRGY